MWSAQAVAAFAKLNIPDLLFAAPKTIAQIANDTKCPPNTIFRLMRAITALEFVRKVDDTYALTDSGVLLANLTPGK